MNDKIRISKEAWMITRELYALNLLFATHFTQEHYAGSMNEKLGDPNPYLQILEDLKKDLEN